jgi:sugar phosphate isomerase/epimerase
MNNRDEKTSRRRILKAGMLAAGMMAAGRPVFGAEESAGAGDQPRLFGAIGMTGPVDRAAALKQMGVEFLTVPTNHLLVPDQPEEKFLPLMEQALASPLPVLACGGFIRPAHLICVGPQANHDQVLEWSAICFERLKRVKARFMVFGSSGTRRVPDGWPREKAVDQFVDLLARMGPLAAEHGVCVAVEQLRAEECNFINHIRDAAAIVRAAKHPQIRLLADFHHMAVGGDTPDDLRAAMDVIVHSEIAEKAERSYPGVKGDDFRPYFRVLRECGYQGAVSIEGKGEENQVAAAIREIARQAAES